MIKQLSYPENKRKIDEMIRKRIFSLDSEYSRVVEKIVKDVSQIGDRALYTYTEKYDGVKLEGLRVSPGEIEEAYKAVEKDFIVSLKKAIKNVGDYHRCQLKQSWFNYGNGGMTGQLINPLNRIGAYVPGGRAPYPSSVVMTVVPARVAGVKEVLISTPPDSNGQINPFILVAAAETGVDEIYKLGGAQAVAALAFGTESVKQVDKIVGPGNIFVTLAKKMVYGMVDIDMLAGPSEVLILADDTARPDFLAADLLSQAEHDPQAVAVLISTEEKLIEKVEEE
ncbi:MAG TPA: histidinol dehydrogenase, partial [Halanaerobiales bacterium]|nr:histidinol dehydrogenase [Halanaerobiales bacterium]